jgi:hypothetical protein
MDPDDPANAMILFIQMVQRIRSQGHFGCGAETGQTFEHAPQSMHALSSIMYLVSPAVMQLTGHSGSQAPQLMQSSLIA